MVLRVLPITALIVLQSINLSTVQSVTPSYHDSYDDDNYDDDQYDDDNKYSYAPKNLHYKILANQDRDFKDCFQLKLDPEVKYGYYDKGKDFCVQCGKSSCRKGKSVKMLECDDYEEKQWWKWEDRKLKSCVDDRLCIDYDKDRKLRVQPCSYYRDDTQELYLREKTEYKHGDRFAMHPKGDEDICLINPHYRRFKSKLMLKKCYYANDSEKHFWIEEKKSYGHHGYKSKSGYGHY